MALLIAGAASARALSVLTYNVAGNGATDWSTNAPQVRAIGRQAQYLQADIITFNEIPATSVWQMADFATAWCPGFQLATNSSSDGYIRSVILSRFPIAASASRLAHANLTPFGCTNQFFTRDLFEAEILVPDYDRPLHVFTTHLKALTNSTDQARRAAEASAISNYLTSVFLPANPDHPYVLTGDLNEDVNRPDAGSLHPVERLITADTGLCLTTPLQLSGNDCTFSSRTAPSHRFDYILPCAQLCSNLVGSRVFRTDVLSPLPPGLLSNDTQTASDHMPVWMVFASPSGNDFRIASLQVEGDDTRLTWTAWAGGYCQVFASSNAVRWEGLPGLVQATNGPMQSVIPAVEYRRFYRLTWQP